jgi:tape measure domain-containing protein
VAEILLGDVVARLKADSSQFTQAMQDAQQRLQQFNQATQQTTQAQRSAAQTALQDQRTTAQTALQAQRTADQVMLQEKRAQFQAQLQAQRAASQAALQEQRTAAQAALQTQREAAQALRAAQASSGGGSLLSGALSVAGGIGLATSIGAIVGQMKDLAVSTVDVATKMQALRASLSALGGGAIAGATQFAQLFQTAQTLGVGFEPLARGFRSLTAAATQAGLPLEDQMRLMRALATEGRRVGASQEELGRAITGVSQIFSKGVVSMEELRQQLGEALPTAMAAAAKGMGTTTEELTKLIETGTARAVPFGKALTRGFEEIQQASGAMADGAQQAFSRLGNAFLAFKDALGANVLPELERVARVAAGILDTATALLALAGGRRDPRLAPNTAQEVQGTAEQEREVQRLRGVIERLNQQAATAVPGPLREQREGMAQRAQEQLDTLLEVIQAKKDEAGADAAETAEINKVISARERQVEFTKQVAEALAKVRQEDEAFRGRAALAPNVLGDPRGTAEQQETFARERQKALQKSVEDLATLAAKPSAGVTLVEEQRKAILALDVDTKKYGDTIDALKEKAREKARVERDAATEARQAAGQALQLTAFQERLDAFLRRPGEGLAEEAASRIRVQGAAIQRELDTQIQALEKSAAFRAESPGALEALRGKRDALQQNINVQAEEAYAEALKKQLQPLQELSGLYADTAAGASELARAQDLVFKLIGTPLEEKAFGYLAYLEKVIQLQRDAAASAPAGMAAVALATRTTTFEQSVTDQLERLRLPREERLEDRLRDEARRKHITLTPETNAQLQAISQQERFNAVLDLTQRVGENVSQSLGAGLTSIADGTKNVSEAFAQMAKSIIDSLAQIAISEGFKALLKIGLSALSGAGGGGGFGGEGGGAIGGDLGFAQGGAIINRPTMLIAGENSLMNPEYVLNRPQMQSLLSAMPSAGGQATGGAGISIINVASRQEADKQAAQEKSLGRQVVINYVMDELSQGSGSRIAQVLRNGQR